MRYLGQNYETEVDVPPIDALDDAGAAEQLERAYAAFHDRHRAMYEYVIADAIIEMISFRVSAIGAIPHPRLARVQPEAGLPESSRQVHFADEGLVDCRVAAPPSHAGGGCVGGSADHLRRGLDDARGTRHERCAEPRRMSLSWR